MDTPAWTETIENPEEGYWEPIPENPDEQEAETPQNPDEQEPETSDNDQNNNENSHQKQAILQALLPSMHWQEVRWLALEQ